MRANRRWQEDYKGGWGQLRALKFTNVTRWDAIFVTLRGSKTDGGGRRRSRLRGQWANSSKACIGKLKTQVRACRKVFLLLCGPREPGTRVERTTEAWERR